MTNPRVDLSLVIACYNEAPLLAGSIEQVIEMLDVTRWNYEIIFVDDCSRDGTRELIEQISAEHPTKALRHFYHLENTGRGRTVSDGFRLATGDVVGYIDIDLEVHARYIPAFVLAVQKGADLVTANRIYRANLRLFHRFLLSRGYARLVRALLGIPLDDTEAGFKFFRREKLLPVLDQMEDGGWFWDTEVIARFLQAGYVVQELPCLFLKRYDKRSSVRVWQDTWDYLVKIIRFRSRLGQRGEPGGRVMRPDYRPLSIDLHE